MRLHYPYTILGIYQWPHASKQSESFSLVSSIFRGAGRFPLANGLRHGTLIVTTAVDKSHLCAVTKNIRMTFGVGIRRAISVKKN